MTILAMAILAIPIMAMAIMAMAIPIMAAMAILAVGAYIRFMCSYRPEDMHAGDFILYA